MGGDRAAGVRPWWHSKDTCKQSFGEHPPPPGQDSREGPQGPGLCPCDSHEANEGDFGLSLTLTSSVNGEAPGEAGPLSDKTCVSSTCRYNCLKLEDSAIYPNHHQQCLAVAEGHILGHVCAQSLHMGSKILQWLLGNAHHQGSCCSRISNQHI